MVELPIVNHAYLLFQLKVWSTLGHFRCVTASGILFIIYSYSILGTTWFSENHNSLRNGVCKYRDLSVFNLSEPLGSIIYVSITFVSFSERWKVRHRNRYSGAYWSIHKKVPCGCPSLPYGSHLQRSLSQFSEISRSQVIRVPGASPELSPHDSWLAPLRGEGGGQVFT